VASGEPTRWLVRFGYDGARFSGWARQPGLPTVEGTIRLGLCRKGIVRSEDSARLEVASRTDRAVSARANALAVSSSLSAEALLHRLNGISREVWFTAAAAVPESFRVRRATRRTYRYFDPVSLVHGDLAEAAVAVLKGPVDARSFGRGVPNTGPRWVRLESVRLLPWAEGHIVEVQAPFFVWGMVRKIVGALRELDGGRLSLARIEKAVRGELRLTLPLAEPEGLVLWNVEYPVRWSVAWTGPNRHQATYCDHVVRSLETRKAVLRAIAPDKPANGAASLGEP